MDVKGKIEGLYSSVAEIDSEDKLLALDDALRRLHSIIRIRRAELGVDTDDRLDAKGKQAQRTRFKKNRERRVVEAEICLHDCALAGSISDDAKSVLAVRDAFVAKGMSKNDALNMAVRGT